MDPLTGIVDRVVVLVHALNVYVTMDTLTQRESRQSGSTCAIIHV